MKSVKSARGKTIVLPRALLWVRTRIAIIGGRTVIVGGLGSIDTNLQLKPCIFAVFFRSKPAQNARNSTAIPVLFGGLGTKKSAQILQCFNRRLV